MPTDGRSKHGHMTHKDGSTVDEEDKEAQSSLPLSVNANSFILTSFLRTPFPTTDTNSVIAGLWEEGFNTTY